MKFKKDSLFGSRKTIKEAVGYLWKNITGLPDESRLHVITEFMVFRSRMFDVLEEEGYEQEEIHGSNPVDGEREEDQ